MKCVGSAHKKQKERDDLINKLPESLIIHILNFLPTKDVVRTSVLSKVWIERWTSVTKLDLDDSLFYSAKRKKSGGKQYFVNFVNRALLLTGSYNVKSISFVITKKYDALLLNTWISSIFKRSVNNICICSDLEFSFSSLTSHALFNNFNSHQLENLVFSMCDCAIKVPPIRSCSFGSLNLLKFCGVIFTLDQSLLIRLPVLKKFETTNCFWLSSHDVTIEAPILETVLIIQHHESVTRESHSCKIIFSASCIKEFTYCSYCNGISQPIALSNPSVACNASLEISLIGTIGSYACLLLKQFSQVKSINFHGSEVLTQQNIADLPKYAMLSHLELGFGSGEVLLGLLQKAPILKTLVFKEISKFNYQELLNSAIDPGCFASTLQVVKFEDVTECEHVLFLAKFFMEKGMVLERMSFSLANWWLKPEVIDEFKEKLYSFKKGVSFAILEFLC